LNLSGTNTLAEEKTSKLTLFLQSFKNVLICILIIAAVISFLIIINSLLGFWQERLAEK